MSVLDVFTDTLKHTTVRLLNFYIMEQTETKISYLGGNFWCLWCKQYYSFFSYIFPCAVLASSFPVLPRWFLITLFPVVWFGRKGLAMYFSVFCYLTVLFNFIFAFERNSLIR